VERERAEIITAETELDRACDHMPSTERCNPSVRQSVILSLLPGVLLIAVVMGCPMSVLRPADLKTLLQIPTPRSEAEDGAEALSDIQQRMSWGSFPPI
jgi:hypothetical protein